MNTRKLLCTAVLLLLAPAVFSAELGKDMYGDGLPPGAVARLGTRRYRMTTWQPATALRFNSTGTELRSGHVGWEVGTGRLQKALAIESPWPGHADSLVALSADGVMALMAESDKQGNQSFLAVRNSRTGELVSRLKKSRLEGSPAGAVFSRDGKFVVVVAVDLRVGGVGSVWGPAGSFSVWETATGNRVFREARPETAVYETSGGWDFSPDGKLLGMTALDGVLRVYDLSQGEASRSVETGAERLLSPRFIDDETLCAAGNEGIFVWKIGEEKTSLWQWPQHLKEAYPRQLAVSPDGRHVVAATFQGLVIVSTDTGKATVPPDEGQRPIEALSVAFSKDGKMLAVGRGQCAEILATENWKPMFPMKSHRSSVVGVATRGERVVTGDEQGAVWLWNLKGEVVRQLTGAGVANVALAFSPDGMAAAGTAGAWDLSSGRLRASSGATVLSRYVDDGKQLLEVHEDRVQWRDAATGELKHEVRPQEKRVITHATVSADGTTLAWSEVNEKDKDRSSGVNPENAAVYTGRVWDVVQRMERATFRVDRHALALSPDGRRLAVGEDVDYSERPATTHVRICDATTGAETHRFADGEWYPAILEWSPDGRWLAMGGGNVTFIMETEKFSQVANLEGHTGHVLGMCWSDNSAHLVTVSRDTTGLVWDIAAVVEHAKQ